MRIHLKQPEIEAALTLYISSQGISMHDKSMNVKFTAGRKGSGLSADLVIEEDPEKANEIPAGPLKRVMNHMPELSASIIQSSTEERYKQRDHTEEEVPTCSLPGPPAEEDQEARAEPEEEKKPVSSLFS